MKPTRSAGAIDLENEPMWMTPPLPAHGIERGRALAVPDQVGIAVVLENRHAILFGELQEFGAARLRHDGAGRVLHGRDGIDVFRRDAAALEIGERRRQRVHPHALMVQRNADRH